MRVVATMLLVGAFAGCGVPKSQYQELETKYNDAVAARDQAQGEADAAKTKLDEVQARNQKRLEAFKTVYAELLKVEEQKLAKVKIEDGRAVLQLESDVLFAPGSANLSPAGVTNVAALAKALSAIDASFQVEGHTDGDAIKSKEFPTNWHLGADRAINVTLEMVKAGMPAERVSAASYGDTKPVVPNDTADHKKENRRIEIVWVPDLAEMLPLKKMMKDVKQDAAEAAAPAPAPAEPAPAEAPK